MAKANDKALAFIQKTMQPSEFQEGFQVRETLKVHNFREEFSAAPLTKEENTEIQHILFDESAANTATDEQVTADHKILIDLTSQIRAIDRQGVLLHGERIHKAREILKKYKDGAFTRWLVVAYGNRQTPYRMLQYYEFFKSLKLELQQLMQAMPRKAAYVLASREGDPEKKMKLIKEHHASKPEDIIRLVQEMFPLEDDDRRKRKENDTVLIESIYSNLRRLAKRKLYLTEKSKEQIAKMQKLIVEILHEDQN
jgi:hypothetical protein